jgi:hypothetical protein
VDWIRLTQDSDRRWAVVNTVINLWILAPRVAHFLHKERSSTILLWYWLRRKKTRNPHKFKYNFHTKFYRNLSNSLKEEKCNPTDTTFKIR